jgi:hypothetical protein
VIEGEQRDKVKESFIKAVGNRPDADTNSAEANEIEKESDLVNLHRRIEDLETNLKGRISNIVVELSAISDQHNTEPSREYNTLLVKQNEHLKCL